MNYAKINLFDIANGPGIRVSLFVSGCRLNCPGCFNKEAHDFNFGNKFDEDKINLILNTFLNDENNYYSGLSILGGEPLQQDEEGLKQLLYLIDRTHLLGKDVWLWTGFDWTNIMHNGNNMQKLVLLNCNYVVEGKFDINKLDLSLAWRGSSNQNIIDVSATKECGEICYKED